MAAPSTRLGQRILLLTTDSAAPGPLVETPSYNATGVLGLGLAPASVVGALECSHLSLSGILVSTGTTLSLDAQLTGDTLRGYATERLADGLEVATRAFGLRVDRAMLLTSDSSPPVAVLGDSTPALLIRLDDARNTDRKFLPRMLARGLVGELAVPTRLVDRPQFLSWREISTWAAAGFGIASHSRYHSAATDGELGFITEVVGSLSDLGRERIRARVFVQPGTWQDSLDFDAPAKLMNWRGALIRNFYSVLEGYVGSDPAPMGTVGHVPFGVMHSTVSDGVSNAFILWQWRRLFVPHTFTVLMIHTWHLQSMDQLDWLLDSVRAAVSHGRLRLVAAASDLREGTARDLR